MSFDLLRNSLKGIDAYILVLDTRGINVWCAAGKGTFGTAELIDRIRGTRLNEVVRHRRIVVPQLGAPGIQAHTIRESTGFRVFYGPVYARDIPDYMKNGYRATQKMRTVRFNFRDRLVGGLVFVSTYYLLFMGGGGQEILKTAIVFTTFPVLSSYIALNFTGATPYTNMSGVKKELKYALPWYILISASSIVLFILYKLKLLGLI